MSSGLQRAALYVFGEKGQIKGIKQESFPKCDFIPVDFYDVRHVKAAFKKLMRACVPSAQTSDPALSFYRTVEECEWLKQVAYSMILIPEHYVYCDLFFSLKHYVYCDLFLIQHSGDLLVTP